MLLSGMNKPAVKRAEYRGIKLIVEAEAVREDKSPSDESCMMIFSAFILRTFLSNDHTRLYYPDTEKQRSTFSLPVLPQDSEKVDQDHGHDLVVSSHNGFCILQ